MQVSLSAGLLLWFCAAGTAAWAAEEALRSPDPVIGDPVSLLLERWGTPTAHYKDFGCDCAGCRTEETYFYNSDLQRRTFTVIDGKIAHIR
jgi:hypothetical protein